MAEFYNICIDFNIRMPCDDKQKNCKSLVKEAADLRNSTSNIIVFCGSLSLTMIRFLKMEQSVFREKTLIISAGSFTKDMIPKKYIGTLNGWLVFSPTIKQIPPLRNFIEDISIANRPDDILLKLIMGLSLHCKTSNNDFNKFLEFHGTKLHTCNESVKFTQLSRKFFDTEHFGITYQVYKAVYAMAHSLHEIQLFMSRNTKSNNHYRKKYKRIKVLYKKLKYT